MNRFMALLLLLVGLALCGAYRADADGPAETHYNQLSRMAAPAVLKSAISAAESMDWTTTPVSAQMTDGNPKITARIDFSVAAATACIEVGLYHKTTAGTYTFLGIASIATYTAANTDSVGTIGARFPAVTMPEVDTRGATHYDMRVTNLSTGNVTVRPWVYGSRSRGTE